MNLSLLFSEPILFFMLAFFVNMLIYACVGCSSKCTMFHERGHGLAVISKNKECLLYTRISGETLIKVSENEYVGPKKIMKEVFGITPAGVCSYDDTSIPFADMMDITKAGPRATVKYLLKHSWILLFSGVMVVARKQIFPETDTAQTVILWIISVVTVYAFYVLIHYTPLGLRKAEKIVEAAKQGDKVNFLISDGSKILFQKRYKKLIETYRAKELSPRLTYEEQKARLEEILRKQEEEGLKK